MSNVDDAIALVSARSNYRLRAAWLEREANEQEAKQRPLTARAIRYKARIAQRAAMAELRSRCLPVAHGLRYQAQPGSRFSRVRQAPATGT